MAITKQEVLALLKNFQTEYENGDPKFFDNFDKEATFFTISTPTRVDGLEEYRRAFEPSLTSQAKRKVQILSPHIQLAGDSATVSSHNRVTVNGQPTNLQVTLTITKGADGNLKIAHFHSSYLAQPGLTSLAAARTPDEVHLLEERVATAAHAVGTPK